MSPPLAQACEAARRAERDGRPTEAIRLLDTALGAHPAHPAALNQLGLLLLGVGRAADAANALERAVAADPGAPQLRIHLADARGAAGDVVGELAALDAALAADPYLLPALLRKAQALERMGRIEESLRAYRALLATTPDSAGLPPSIAEALAHGAALLAADAARRLAALEEPLAPIRAATSAAEMRRADAYVEALCGTRAVFRPAPTGPHFPFLQAPEFLDRTAFPWFAELEAATDDMRREFLAVWRDDGGTFEPYVRFEAGVPLNQWAELNNSPRWGSLFLWRDGTRQEDNIKRCPLTAACMQRLPLLDVPGKAPTVMFSVLAPHTRIPPHTGVTNTRATVHLPLIVPGPARFRVGGETRTWREGEAWAFDDTIEHEAWNDADRPRIILIIDAWNPFLTDVERAVVRAAAGAVRL